MDQLLNEFITCTCEGEAIRVQLWNFDDYEVFFSIWEEGVYTVSTMRRVRFIDRIKKALQVFSKDTFYGDQIILSKEKTIKLRDFLTQCIEKMEQSEDEEAS
jgi:hypothetical protein